jgi:hypothetical protein
VFVCEQVIGDSVRKKRAYGCGNNIQAALEGLARLGHDPHLDSSLAIRMTEGPRRRFESELDPDYSRSDVELPSDLIARARVQMAEEHGVTVILLKFSSSSLMSALSLSLTL